MCYAGETSHDVQIRGNVNKSMAEEDNAAEAVMMLEEQYSRNSDEDQCSGSNDEDQSSGSVDCV